MYIFHPNIYFKIAIEEKYQILKTFSSITVIIYLWFPIVYPFIDVTLESLKASHFSNQRYIDEIQSNSIKTLMIYTYT